MKSQSMDASTSTQFQKIQGPSIKSETREDVSTGVPTEPVVEKKLHGRMTEYEKKELPIPEKIIIDAIEKANKAISGGNRRFEFSIHEKTKQIMVKVINSDTNEIVREIPPEKTLDMVAKMWEMAGIMVDERR